MANPEKVGREQVFDFLRNNPARRADIVRYLQKERDDGLVPLGEKAAGRLVSELYEEKAIWRRNWKFYVRRPQNTRNQKITPKTRKPSKSKDGGAGQNNKIKITGSFSERVKKESRITKSLQETAFLLEAVLLLLDKIHPSDHSHKTAISEKKERCQAHLASVKKINEEFAHLVVQRENQYGAIVIKAQESYKERHRHGMIMEGYNAAAFRDAFSDVILQIREECARMCFASPATHEEGAVNDSCRLASIALNEACRNGYDLVVNSYEYDKVQGIFKIDLSELKENQLRNFAGIP